MKATSKGRCSKTLLPISSKPSSRYQSLEFRLSGDDPDLHALGPHRARLVQDVPYQALSETPVPVRRQHGQPLQVTDLWSRYLEGGTTATAPPVLEDKEPEPLAQRCLEPCSRAEGGMGGTVLRGEREAFRHVAKGTADDAVQVALYHLSDRLSDLH